MDGGRARECSRLGGGDQIVGNDNLVPSIIISKPVLDLISHRQFGSMPPCGLHTRT